MLSGIRNQKGGGRSHTAVPEGANATGGNLAEGNGSAAGHTQIYNTLRGPAPGRTVPDMTTLLKGCRI